MRSLGLLLPISTLALLGACGSGPGGSAPSEGVSTELSTESVNAQGELHNAQGIRHVLLISVDGLHQVDVDTYIAANPGSTLASLAARGVEYTDAHTTTPSDSFPGMIALVSGATSKTSGVYYDDSYDRTLYAPGSNCAGNPGTEIVMDESLEFDDTKVFSGGINPANLPMAKDALGTCKPVFPHDFIRTNTVFEVIRAFGGHTAWSDKHPAYDI